MNNEQIINDVSFYISICVLRRLLKMGLVSGDEQRKVIGICTEHYRTNIIVIG